MPKVKATAPTVLPADLVPRDFIYCGRRLLSSGKIGYEVQLLEEVNGALQFYGTPKLYQLRAGRRRIMGGIYTGAKFTEGQSSGIDLATFKGQWKDQEHRLIWTGEDEAVEMHLKEERLRKDETRMNEIERVMAPLRATYQKLYETGDIGSARAFQTAVHMALLRRGATRRA